MDTEFAYWVPNVSGGLVVSDWETETDWTYDYNLDLARTAESVGFDYALAQARFFGSYGADKQLEALSIANALAAQTDELHVIGAVHPGLWEPGPLANFIATSDRISNGRFSINIVSGWFKGEFTGFGQPWLEHDERYARSSEFIEVLKALWTEERATYDGRFYTIGKDIEGFEGAPLEPKPVQDPYPQVFQGGNSQAAREMAAKHSDVLFINGGSLQEIRAVIDDVEEYAEEFGTEPPRFAANAFVIQRDTESEAKEVLEGIIENATDEAVDAFKDQVKEAGQSSGEGEGMWADSDFEDLVQYNDGFKTGLIGTDDQIVERIRKLDAIGVDIVLAGFLDFEAELERFGETIIPAIDEADSLDPDEVDAVDEIEEVGGAKVAR
ncbi:dimethylsulfone monooxygenase SfnG [Halorubrum lacusprofundi]|jgi:FMNH2-dependent dimethyl sulfone monooxygenase|uniref:Luciferase-like monooxygenase n=1 Tax=Halorubrum lacusprofundi (strain ATCC 49239 / DSM 5036 / JCM 8891 / ACAM 34) TaxID=416348 RepID=B9LMQ5_HALLT|nr:dimethyl sulfone monooxygenase SfnG [Halorubrum lacusprofundi]ACM56643.1 Luciferase-like monooxygenase [Halorubrum lacusprofundi ATCC 49239]MCG1005092.1 dimethyl sulfone monooxygenase SfnG [Halorubrum lacusprofundi]